MSALEALRYQQGPPASLRLLDQRRLPFDTVYEDITGPSDAFSAIKDMKVRGAPAIAIAAALALAVELRNTDQGSGSAAAAARHIEERMEYLVTSRPTAVNLSEAAKKLTARAKASAAAQDSSAAKVRDDVASCCEAMLQTDINANKAMGKHGASAMLEAVAAAHSKDYAAVEVDGAPQKLRVLTHCNTGSLATAAYGTALGVIRALHSQGSLEHAFCTETRPYNQGSRLTAFELVHDQIPATLIADSAVGALMAAGRVDAVVVGADRIAANGDTANKIGTLSLAANAHLYGIPFFVAAPTTTLDPSLAAGSQIVIEERSPQELTHFQGRPVAAGGVQVWNPAFDVTPARLIAGIITEHGLVPKGSQGFQVESFMEAHASTQQAPNKQQPGLHDRPLNGCHPAPAGYDKASDSGAKEDGAGSSAGPAKANGAGSAPDLVKENGAGTGFRALDTESVKAYLAGKPALAACLGDPREAAFWQVQEVGDGNINFVYIVEGPQGGLVVKQGLPYIRIAPDWPLTQERARYEAQAMAEEYAHCPQHVPKLHLYDADMALIVMQYLEPPHNILRRALVAGEVFPRLGAHVAHFLAKTLFRTSLYALDTSAWRDQVAKFKNTELCRLTEQVIFTDPYYAAPVNRHTSPFLDDVAQQFRQDVAAKAAAAELKAKFIERAQALLHGDLHTGSLMCTQDTTYMIDAEFAFYGPMAFDVQKMIANLLIAYCASFGLETADGPRDRQRAWMLQATQDIWDGFKQEFAQQWSDAVASGRGGDLALDALYGPTAPAGSSSLQAVQEAFFKDLELDTVGFAGAVIIRRILGIAHVVDFESIEDPATRAKAEMHALKLARRMLVERHDELPTVAKVIQAAKQG